MSPNDAILEHIRKIRGELETVVQVQQLQIEEFKRLDAAFVQLKGEMSANYVAIAGYAREILAKVCG